MSAELVYRLRPEGAEQLRKIVESVKASDDAVRRAAGGLRDYDSAAGKAVASSAAMSASLGFSVGVWTKVIDVTLSAAGALLRAGPAMAKLAEQQAHTAAQTGLTVREVGLFEAAAEDAGLSANAYTSAMRSLSHTLTEGGSESSKARRALRDLNVVVEDGFGAIRPMGQIWLDFTKAIGSVQDPARRAQLAVDVLGRSGLDLLPQLNSEFGRTLEAYRAMGVGFDDVGLKTARNLGNAVHRMRRSLQALRQETETAIANFLGFGVDPKNVKPLSQAIAEANRDRDILLSGGILPLDAPAPKGAKPATLEQVLASRRTSDLQKINAELQRTLGLEDRLRDAHRERDEAQRVVDVDRFRRAQAEIAYLERAVEAERKRKQETAEHARLVERLGKFEHRESDNPLPPRRVAADGRRLAPSLFRPGESRRTVVQLGDGSFVDVGSVFRAGDLGAAPGAEQDKAYAAGLAARLKAEGDQREQMRTRERDHRLRMIELTAGPGGELAAARAVYELRLRSAATELERQDARIALEERLAQLQQDNIRRYEETAGRVYDAIRQRGGGGLRDLVRGQVDILGRQLFVNASSEFFQAAGGTLGRIGEASGLGRLLRGTIFDPANAQKPLDRNSAALGRLTRSVDRLTGQLAGGPIAIGSDGAISVPGGVLQGAPGGLGVIFSLLGRGGSGDLPLSAGLAGRNANLALNLLGVPSTPAAGKGIGALQRGLGYGAAAAAGAFGVYSGIREGGLGGGLTAASSALGAASLIPGPQQPFLQAAALLTGLVRSFLPDRKAQAEREQIERLNAARYTAPAGVDVVSDRYGNAVDYDFRGNVRVIERPVYVRIDALDARSIADRRQDIATAVRDAILEGTDLRDTVRGLSILPN